MLSLYTHATAVNLCSALVSPIEMSYLRECMYEQITTPSSCLEQLCSSIMSLINVLLSICYPLPHQQLLHLLVERYLEPLQSENFISPTDVCIPVTLLSWHNHKT